MKSFKSIVFSLLLFITCACEHIKEENNRLKDYLSEVFSADIEEAMYIIVPMNSCSGCREVVYRNLLSAEVQKTMKVILVGEVQEALTLNYINRLNGKGIEVLRDVDGQAVQYDLLEVDYPLSHISLIDIEDSKVISSTVLKPNMVNGEVDIRKEVFKNYIK